MLSRRKAPKTQQIAVTNIREKLGNFLDGIRRALTLASEIILLT